MGTILGLLFALGMVIYSFTGEMEQFAPPGDLYLVGIGFIVVFGLSGLLLPRTVGTFANMSIFGCVLAAAISLFTDAVYSLPLLVLAIDFFVITHLVARLRPDSL